MARVVRKEFFAEIQIAPMIDCVFLLLIYFIMTSSLARQEADVSFRLPGVVEQEEPLEMPDEQWVEIGDDGGVQINGFDLGNAKEGNLARLRVTLKRFSEASAANRVKAAVTLVPCDQVPHQWVIRVMDVCSESGIESVGFALTDN